jgi:phospholipid/cholesterol/gamma-HCH transport system permease protein
MEPSLEKPTFECRRPTRRLVVIRFVGTWMMDAEIPAFQELQNAIGDASQTDTLAFDTKRLAGWDSQFLTTILKIHHYCQAGDIAFDGEGLPDGARRMLKLATAVPERQGARRPTVRQGVLVRAGQAAIAIGQALGEFVAFTGEIALAFVRLFSGRARFPRRDFGVLLQNCGSQALPIVSLISVLVGLILAFVGAVQLRMFGAQIFVANLVGLGMAREMGAMMAAVIMAGRTGAAFAAQLGTMQVNEEIDALVTMGISPIDYLVLPRTLALVLMMPLLCLYANFMGILGGVIVGTGLLDLPLKQYLLQTQQAVGLNDFAVGLVKSAIFGVIVAMAGCLRGMQCGRSAMAVGAAATSAGVTAIVYIVVSDALITVICDIIGV